MLPGIWRTPGGADGTSDGYLKHDVLVGIWRIPGTSDGYLKHELVTGIWRTSGGADCVVPRFPAPGGYLKHEEFAGISIPFG